MYIPLPYQGGPGSRKVVVSEKMDVFLLTVSTNIISLGGGKVGKSLVKKENLFGTHLKRHDYCSVIKKTHKVLLFHTFGGISSNRRLAPPPTAVRTDMKILKLNIL